MDPRKLHHLSAPGVQQHITFRLNDSFPASTIKRIEHNLSELPEISYDKARSKHLHQLLDQGYGSCLFQMEYCAAIVEQSLMFGNERRYKLLAWCIMPNHVHVLLEQLEGWSIDKVVQSWKRYTSREIGRLGYFTGTSCSGDQSPSSGIWQRNYWDRYIRNDEHLMKVKGYIEQNPVKAGLVSSAGDWRWGSAFRQGL